MKRSEMQSAAPPCSATDLLLAAILLGRFSPLAPHHAGAIRERLRELNDNELREMVATGKWPTPKVSGGGSHPLDRIVGRLRLMRRKETT
jgi:hypothetical protein